MAASISPCGAQVIAWAWSMFSLATLVVFIRLWVRAKMVRVVGREDLFLTIALVFSLLQSIFLHHQASQGGLGRRVHSLTPSQIRHFIKDAYFTVIAYNASLCATKFSILFLCLRIFDVAKWRKIYYAVLVLLGLFTLWIVIYSIIPCVPIRSQWDRTVSGWCFPRMELLVLNAALNILTDFLIVILPIPAIMTLHLPKKQKIGLSITFALGFFVCIISILRIPSVIKIRKVKDPAYDTCVVAIWSIVEVNAAIIGACLPMIKPLLTRMWPGLLSSIHNTNTHSYYQHSLGADRTATTTYGRTLKSGVAAGPEPDDSSTTNVLGDRDIMELEAIEKNITGRHTRRSDDSRSEVATVRSMDNVGRGSDVIVRVNI